MNTKKFFRILLSPLVFLLVFITLTVFPFGLISLVTGLFEATVGQLKEDAEKPEWTMVFMWITFPYMSAAKWIEDGDIDI